MPINVKIERIESAELEITRMSNKLVQLRELYMRDGIIDDVEQVALDRVKSNIEGLQTLVATLRAEIEENKRIWESHAGEWTEAQNRLQALQAFRHPDAAAMATSVGDVSQAIPDQRWADATAALEQVQTNMGPIWADYERQVAAQTEYDPMRLDFDNRMAAAGMAEPQTEEIVGRVRQIQSNLSAMDASVTARDYVTALASLHTAVTELEALEAEIMRVQQAKADYDTALASLQPRLTEASTSEYQTLTELQAPLIPLQDAMEAAGLLHDYETAMLKLRELETAVDAFLTARETLDAARLAYEAKLGTLAGRLAAASVSEMGSTSELQQNIITAEDAMTAAAQAELFDDALRLAGDVETALVAYEAVIEDRDLYQARLAAMSEELMEASVSQAKWTYLEPIQSAMATLQTEMETAATAEDFATALVKISALETKLAEFFAAIEAKRVQYEAERSPLEPRLTHLNACNYPLAAQKTAVTTAFTDVDAAVTEEDWDGALNGVASAEAALDNFDTAHDAHDATLRSQITAELPALRTAANDPGNGELSSAATLRQNIAALDSALGGTGDLDTMIALMNRAKQLSTELERLRSIRDRIDDSWDEDGTALEIYDELKASGDLASLPIEARNMLVETLLEDGIFDSVDGDEQAAVQEIWSSASALDPAFEAADTAVTKRIVSQLENDPEVQEYAANWSTMTAAEQQAAMEHVGGIIGGPDGWGIEGNEDVDYSVDQGNCPTNPRLKGWHRDASGDNPEEISICMSNNIPGAGWNPSSDFADVVLNLTHEVGHGYQDDMRARFDAGEIPRGDPEYEQARLLSLDRRYFEEFPDDYDDWNTYVHSPMEQQSRRTGNRVQNDLPPEFGAGNVESVN